MESKMPITSTHEQVRRKMDLSKYKGKVIEKILGNDGDEDMHVLFNDAT